MRHGASGVRAQRISRGADQAQTAFTLAQATPCRFVNESLEELDRVKFTLELTYSYERGDAQRSKYSGGGEPN